MAGRLVTPEQEKLAAEAQARQRDYRATFNSPTGQNVLIDLYMLTFGKQSTTITGKDGHVDVYGTFEANGMRKIWLHIEQQMKLRPDQLAELYLGYHFKPEDDHG